ncbi:MAG: hypothetical protein V4538_17585 [Bacteroidota bacterium]
MERTPLEEAKSGIPEFDTLIDDYAHAQISFDTLISRLWNEGYKAGQQANKPEQGMKDENSILSILRFLKDNHWLSETEQTIEYIKDIYLDEVAQLSTPLPAQREERWQNTKPEFTKECLLMTATFYPGGWEYQSWWIKKLIEPVDEKWYWGLLQLDGGEYGCIKELQADRYLVIELPGIK